MQDTFECQFAWTLDEFITANQQHRGHSRPVRQLLLILRVIAVVFLFAAIVRHVNIGFNKTSVFLLIVGVSILLSRVFGRRVLARMFAKMPDRDTNIRWQIYPDRMVIETASSRTESAWSRIASYVRTDKGFLLYPHPGVFYWLPFHSFPHPSDIDRFDQLIARQIGQIASKKVQVNFPKN